MTEEAAPAVEEQDTPTPDPGEDDSQEGTPSESPEDSAAPEDTNYEERYKEAQAWGTRAAQEASQYRQIIDLARQGDPDALQYLGYEAPTDTEDDDGEDLSEAERLERLERTLAERTEAEEQARKEQELEEAENRFYEAELSKLDPKDEWSEEYTRAVVGTANQIEPDDDGLPNLEAAHKLLQEHFEAEFQARVKSKRSPQAPSGAGSSHQPDLDDDEQRRDYITRRLAEAENTA